MAWDKLASSSVRHARPEKETISIMSEPLPGFKQSSYQQSFMTYPDVPEVSPRFMRAINRESPFHSDRYKTQDDSTEGTESGDDKIRTSTSTTSSTCSTKKTTINLLEGDASRDKIPLLEKEHLSSKLAPGKLFRSQYVQASPGKEIDEFWRPENCIRCKQPITDTENFGNKTVSFKTYENGLVEIKLCVTYRMFLTISLIVSGLVMISLAVGWPGCLLGCSRKLAGKYYPKTNTIYDYLFS
ncbi:uncharacterized protein LOC106664625 [Cimex lectularius]|uniref:Uncharacterized protein n=1 Tax=Cimex lectularius TaxID=79782 RepID=A0A8I6RM95_CIMLE|nr:uncharacterized protein LOC106664625 [Cimex lectularius]